MGEQTPATSLVFLHYFGGAGRAWAPVVERLGDRERCLAPDLPGFGGAADLPAFSVADMASAVARVIAARGLAHAVLVGHSMGGKIAMTLAATRPAWLRGLVLVAPSPPTPEPMEAADRAAALRAHGDTGAAAATLRRVTRRPLSPDRLDEQVADHLRVSAGAWNWWLEAGSRETISAAVAAIDVPTLVIGAEDDPVIGPAVIDGVMVAIPAARRVRVPDCGHLVPLEAPAALVVELQAFMTRIDRHRSTKGV